MGHYQLSRKYTRHVLCVGIIRQNVPYDIGMLPAVGFNRSSPTVAFCAVSGTCITSCHVDIKRFKVFSKNRPFRPALCPPTVFRWDVSPRVETRQTRTQHAACVICGKGTPSNAQLVCLNLDLVLRKRRLCPQHRGCLLCGQSLITHGCRMATMHSPRRFRNGYGRWRAPLRCSLGGSPIDRRSSIPCHRSHSLFVRRMWRNFVLL